MEQGELDRGFRRTRSGGDALRTSPRRRARFMHLVPTLGFWVGILGFGIGVGFGVAHAESDTAVNSSGPAQVRKDLFRFLEIEGQGDEVSVSMPPLAAFEFDSERLTGPIRTELSSRMEPPYRGRVAVTVSLFAGERLIKRAIVSPYVQVGEDVVVASRDLRRGDILSERDLQVVERDQARLSRGFFGEIEDLVGSRMKRGVRRGKVIVASATEEVPVVERGDRVVVVLQSGPMKLQSIGRAQEAGVIGQWIRVLNLESKKELSGRLDRSGRVHVAF